VTAEALSLTLRQLADFAEIRGVSLEVTAWWRLASAIEGAGDAEIARLTTLARLNRLDEVTVVPPTLHWRIREILVDGPDLALRTVWTRLPWMLRWLLERSVVDSAEAAAMARAGVVTAADLDAALHADELPADLATTADRLHRAAASLAEQRPRVTLGRAVEVVDTLAALLAGICPEIRDLTPAGSIRRVDPIADALIVVGLAHDPVSAIDALADQRAVQVLHRTGRRALVGHHQLEVDLRIASPDEFGTALYLATGSAAHVQAMRSRQPTLGPHAREAEVYSHAGVAWIAPELRHGLDEIETAARGALPELVDRHHVRGDLHLHSTYSDGRDSLAEMVETCADLGYQYIAITDHSERAQAPKTVSRDDLRRQRDEIDRLQERFPAMTILHGIEVDIMPDGRLDFPDEVLATLDIVLASLHVRAGHDRARLTRRCLAAIAHPLVNVITHPANRLVGHDDGYDLDFAAIYEAAIDTGTALEIDGAPSHLDLDGDRAREATAAGVTVTIDSDCHRARLLDRQMRFAIGTARRGSVEPRHVLNTRPVEEVRAFIAAKRRPHRQKP
jgi:DNA polymerase (family 10)